MKITLILPVAVLAVGVLACLAMRQPAVDDTHTAGPDAAEESDDRSKPSLAASSSMPADDASEIRDG